MKFLLDSDNDIDKKIKLLKFIVPAPSIENIMRMGNTDFMFIHNNGNTEFFSLMKNKVIIEKSSNDYEFSIKEYIANRCHRLNKFKLEKMLYESLLSGNT